LTLELLEVLAVFDVEVVEADFHVVGEYEDAAQNMIVVIIPNILKRMLKYFLFLEDIHDFKAFQFHISDSHILRINTKGFPIATYAVLKSKVDLLVAFLCIINLNDLFLFVLNYDEGVHHESEGVGDPIILSMLWINLQGMHRLHFITLFRQVVRIKHHHLVINFDILSIAISHSWKLKLRHGSKMLQASSCLEVVTCCAH